MAVHPDRMRVGAALLALFAVIGLYAFLQSPYFAITEVRVLGTAQLDPEVLIQRAQVRVGDNVLHVDLRAVAGRLVSHPRIQHAAVVRQLPGVLELRVMEYEPLVRTDDEEGSVGLARDGTRVPLGEGEADKLPVLTGVPDEVLPIALEASALLPPVVRESLSAIGFDPDVGVWLETKNGVRMLIGDGPELERQLAIAVELLDEARYRLIDVRLPRAPVVRSE